MVRLKNTIGRVTTNDLLKNDTQIGHKLYYFAKMLKFLIEFVCEEQKMVN